MNYLPFVIFGLVIIGLLLFSARARRRQAAAQEHLIEAIDVGTAVMTTSGLHGVVVAANDDDTVQLSIAPGVEVRWELAALRDVASLPDRYAGHVGEPDPGGSEAVDRPPSAAGIDLGKAPDRGSDAARAHRDSAADA